MRPQIKVRGHFTLGGTGERPFNAAETSARSPLCAQAFSFSLSVPAAGSGACKCPRDAAENKKCDTLRNRTLGRVLIRQSFVLPLVSRLLFFLFKRASHAPRRALQSRPLRNGVIPSVLVSIWEKEKRAIGRGARASR